MLIRVLVSVLKFASRRGRLNRLHVSDISSLLIIELTRLGDVLSMLPALHILHVNFPAARIHLLVDKRFDHLLRNVNLGAEIHGIRYSNSLAGLVRAILQVRSLKVDLTVSMSPSQKNAITALASSSPFKVGYLSSYASLAPFLKNTPVEAFGFALEKTASYGRENIKERSLKICEVLGLPPTSRPFELTLQNDIASSIRGQLRDRRVLPSSEYLVVHPFSGWEFRTWDINRFGVLVERIVTLFKRDVVFTCALRESIQLEPLRQRFKGNRKVHFFPSGDILETAVLLKNATLFIGNDSGPIHLASVLGTPIVGLYGPADPGLTGPVSVRGSYMYKRVECSPCDQRRCIRPSDPCVNLITPDEVLTAVADLIGPKILMPTPHHG